MTRFAITIASLTALQACGDPCGPLVDVPVRGGTDAQQQAIGSTLAQYDEWLLAPVCLSHVRLTATQVTKGYIGRYNKVTRGVRVADHVPLESLPWVVGHELSHGVHLQLDIDTQALLGLDRKESRERFADIGGMGAAGLNVLLQSGCAIPESELGQVRTVADALFLPPDHDAEAHVWIEEGAREMSLDGLFYDAYTANDGTYVCASAGGRSFCAPRSGEPATDPVPQRDPPHLPMESAMVGFSWKWWFRDAEREHAIVRLNQSLPFSAHPVVTQPVRVLTTVDSDGELVQISCLSPLQDVVNAGQDVLLVQSHPDRGMVTWSRLATGAWIP